MHKPSAKKLLFIVGTVVLAFAAFFAGGIALSSAHAASTNVLNGGTVQSACDKKNPQCKGDHQGNSTNQIKSIATIISVAGNRIQATVLEPSDKKESVITIITTSSTIYQPDQSVVAAGKTVFIAGTVNSDGSITAQTLGFYDPTVADLGGVVTSINGSTLTVQVKGNTQTILLTASTTFLQVQSVKSGTKQPASLSDLKVGETIEAHGKLNGDGSLTADIVLILLGGTSAK